MAAPATRDPEAQLEAAPPVGTGAGSSVGSGIVCGEMSVSIQIQRDCVFCGKALTELVAKVEVGTGASDSV